VVQTQIRRASGDEIGAISAGLGDRNVAQHVQRLEHQEQGHSVYLIAWRSAFPVGHVEVRWPSWPERSVPEFTLRYGCAWVEDVAVQSSYRGRGIGKALMEAVEHEASLQGQARVWLAVGLDEGYATARRLYGSLGYLYLPHGAFLESSATPGGGTWKDWLVAMLKELR
jgi:GNAT superfamily N-acetyltransferase